MLQEVYIFHFFNENCISWIYKNICLKSCIDEEFRDGKDNKNALIIFWWKIGKSCIFPSLNEQYKKRVIRRGYVVWALQNVAANALCCFDATAIFAVTLKTINFFPLFEITKKENLHVSFSPRDLEVTTVLSEPPTLFLMQMQ